MSSASNSERISLQVRPENAFTEVVVIDSDLRLAGKGVGPTLFELPPGLYSVKFKSGDAYEERMVALRPGSGPQEVEGEKLMVSSPAPLLSTSTSHEYQSYPAADHSRGMGPSDCGCLYIFVRHVRQTKRWLPPNVWVYDMAGERVGDINDPSLGSHVEPDSAYGFIRVWLKPGYYRIRQGSFQPREIGVQVCHGWQTQVFATTTETSTGRYYADFANASVMMSPPNDGFHNDSPEFKLTESARLALLSDRSVPLDEGMIQEMAWGKFQDPMLGIYGAYLMLRQAKPAFDKLTEIVGNLRNLINCPAPVQGVSPNGFSHPDLDIIDLVTRQKTGGKPIRDIPPFASPPTLREGYAHLIEAAIAQQWLIPMGSFTSDVSTHLDGNGLWLRWFVTRSTGSGKKKMPTSQLQPLVAKLQDYVTAVDSNMVLQKALDDMLNQGRAESARETTPRRNYVNFEGEEEEEEEEEAVTTRSFEDDFADEAPSSGAEPPEVSYRKEAIESMDTKQIARQFGVPINVARAALNKVKGSLTEES